MVGFVYGALAFVENVGKELGLHTVGLAVLYKLFHHGVCKFLGIIIEENQLEVLGQ